MWYYLLTNYTITNMTALSVFPLLLLLTWNIVKAKLGNSQLYFKMESISNYANQKAFPCTTKINEQENFN